MTSSDNPEIETTEKKPPAWLKTATDFGPLLAFFVANWLGGIFWATGVIMVAIGIASAINWFTAGKISPMHIVTLVFVLIFGGLTLWLADETFIKVKVSLVNGLFGTILLAGWLRGKALLKFVMGEFLKLDDAGWMKLSLRWAMLFYGLALLNEIVWRTVSTDTWVTFKVFGLLAITMIFGMAQMPLISKHLVEEEGASASNGENAG